MGLRSKLKVGSLQKNNECRSVKKFLSRRLIMNGRRIWNLHQRNKFLRVEASRDILKFRVLEMAFPGVFKRNFPMGDSRKYPYHTTDGFKDFRRGGGIHDYGILKAWGGYLQFEIRRYGGIPQVGFLE